MNAWNLVREMAAVAVGGACGSVLRHLAGVAVSACCPGRFPWAILLVNVVGCLLIGALGEWYTLAHKLPEWSRLLLVTGFLGGLTTFSSFGYDTLRQMEVGNYAGALANIGANVVLGLFAVWLGVALVRQLLT